MKIKTWVVAGGAAAAMAASLALRPLAFAQPAPTAPAAAAQAAAPDGEALFNQRCKSCHEPPVERAPSRTTLAAFPRAEIVNALTSGAMQPMAAGLSQADIAAVAAFLTPSQSPVAAASPRRRRPSGPVGVDKMCADNPPIQPGDSDWSSLGVDPASTRFQPHPGLRLADLPKLKVKWAFALAGGGQPIVVGDWLFTTNRSGKFYALDAKTGCVHWATEGAGSRTTPMIVRSTVSPSGWATFIGVGGRVLRAFDAQTGKEIWKSEPLENHPASGITGSPVVAGDKVFVPLTSGEEGAGRQATYSCCSFRGAVAAVDIKTGKLLWKSVVIPEPLRPTTKNSAGTQMQGPAGGAIWSAPTVDLKRGVIYVGTGDSYTDTPTKGTDAVDAIDMKTGKIRWSTQVTAGDNFLMGCSDNPRPPNCPTPVGPDYDFGASPILFTLASGRQVVVAGQKAGLVYGFDPDTGKVLWKTRVGTGSPLGGVEWGIASDKRRVFAPNSDLVILLSDLAPTTAQPSAIPPGPARPGLSALDPATGKVVWQVPAPVAPCHYAGDRSSDYSKGACVRAQSAAPSAMPGAVFSGTLDGWLRAYDAATGKIIWAFSSTAQTYDTVNQVKGQPGGGIDGMGPTIAGGMVYTMSGYNGASNTGGNGVNVLLAFSVDGK